MLVIIEVLKLECCIVLRAEGIMRSVMVLSSNNCLKFYFHEIVANEIKIIEYKIERAA